jgi:hypothetical protein
LGGLLVRLYLLVTLWLLVVRLVVMAVEVVVLEDF